MSGLEIAGVVLGSIPLLISGLEHYAEGASTIKRMFRAPGEFRSLSRRLRVEHDIFRNSMELLLTNCVDDVELQDLLEHVGGNSWSEPAVDVALRKKLNRSYNVYMETVEDMNQTLVAFRERLKLGDDGKVGLSLTVPCMNLALSLNYHRAHLMIQTPSVRHLSASSLGSENPTIWISLTRSRRTTVRFRNSRSKAWPSSPLGRLENGYLTSRKSEVMHRVCSRLCRGDCEDHVKPRIKQACT